MLRFHHFWEEMLVTVTIIKHFRPIKFLPTRLRICLILLHFTSIPAILHSLKSVVRNAWFCLVLQAFKHYLSFLVRICSNACITNGFQAFSWCARKQNCKCSNACNPIGFQAYPVRSQLPPWRHGNAWFPLVLQAFPLISCVSTARGPAQKCLAYLLDFKHTCLNAKHSSILQHFQNA